MKKHTIRKKLILVYFLAFLVSLNCFNSYAENIEKKLDLLETEVYQEKQRIRSLREELFSIQQDKKNMDSKLKSLDVKDEIIENLKKDVKDCIAREERLIKDLQSADKKIIAVSRKLEDKEACGSQAKLSAKQAEKIEFLRTELGSNRKEMDGLIKDIKVLTKDIKAKDRELNRLHEKESVFLDKESVNDCEKDLSVKMREISGLKGTVKALSRQIEQVEAKNKDAQGQNKAIKEVKQALSESLDKEAKLFKDLKIAKGELERLEAELKKSSKEKAVYKLSPKQKEDMSNLKKDVASKDKENRILQKQIVRLEKECSVLSPEQKEVMADLQINVTEKSKEIVILQKQMARLEKESESRGNSKLKQKISDIKQSLKDSQMLVAKLQKDLKLSDKEISRSNVLLDKSDKEVENLKAKLKARENSSLSKKNKDLDRQLKAKNNEIVKLNQELSKQSQSESQQVNSLRQQLVKKDKEIEYLKGVIKEAIDKIRSLSGAISSK